MSLLYRQAASTLRALEQRKKTVKGVVHEGGERDKKSQTMAIRCLQYKSVLDEILNECGANAEQMDTDPYMLYIQVYELLFGMGKIMGGGEVKRKLAHYFDKLQKCKEEKMTGKSEYRDLLSKELQLAQELPLYIRVNTCLVTMNESLAYLREKLSGLSISLDEQVPSLIVVAPGPEGFGTDEWVQNGRLILQDKASCFPAQILANHYYFDSCNAAEGLEYHGDIIDACAAPGNKTSQLATFLHHQNLELSTKAGKKSKKKAGSTNNIANADSKVWAFDKSADRAAMLQQRMQSLHVDHLVTVTNQDFLSIDVLDPKFARVRNILLDPSCSGSGIVRNAIDRIVERQQQNTGASELNEDSFEALPASDRSRVMKLQAFQLLALQKAMSFPQVQRVVYSTCSVHVEENEGVVGRLLHESPAGITQCWRLVPPKGFESWRRRGLIEPSMLEKYHLTAEQSRCMIRCKPEDGMNGFFVTMFERVQPWNEPIELPLNSRNLVASHDDSQETTWKKRKQNNNDHYKQSDEDISFKKQKKTDAEKPSMPLLPPKGNTFKAKLAELPTAGSSFFAKSFIVARSKKRFGRK